MSFSREKKEKYNELARTYRREVRDMAKLKSENLRIAQCKGCGYCVESCPKAALQLGDQLNKQGYRYILLDEGLCVVCGICRTVCPDNVFAFTEE